MFLKGVYLVFFSNASNAISVKFSAECRKIQMNAKNAAFCSVCHEFMHLENVKSFTRTNINQPDFTPRKARKLRQFWHIDRTKKDTFEIRK